MNNYQTWLETPGVVRIALVQAEVSVNSTPTTRYLSTHAVTVGGINYLPVISGDITIDETISTEYSASISYGDVALINSAGQYDSWLNDIWINKPVKIYIGSLPLPGTTATLSDFELVFDGLIADIDSKDRSHLNIKLRDKLEKLNTSISENLLGNYFQGGIVPEADYVNQYRNNLKPICYGEVHNITPLLTDPGRSEYMVNYTGVEQIIEVRDNGTPVAFNTSVQVADIPQGSFRLVSGLGVGTITCSVQGIARTVNVAGGSSSNTYTNTASNTILDILKWQGQQLAYSDIDASSFATLGSQAVGVYIPDRVNVLNICQDIAKSCGLILSVTRLGKVRLVDLTIPASSSTTITDSDIMLNSLVLSRKLDVTAGIRLGYAKNWTIQTNLTTSIPQQHKDLFATEYLESTQSDPVAKAAYLITTEPALEGTFLIDKAQADVISAKKLTLFKTPRKIYSMKCTAKLLSLQVGDSVTLTSSRFGLSGGVLGLVISTKPNWLNGNISVEVMT